MMTVSVLSKVLLVLLWLFVGCYGWSLVHDIEKEANKKGHKEGMTDLQEAIEKKLDSFPQEPSHDQ